MTTITRDETRTTKTVALYRENSRNEAKEEEKIGTRSETRKETIVASKNKEEKQQEV